MERRRRLARMRRAVREYGLTAGTLGSTAGQTLMVVLLPVLLFRYTNSAVLIGLVIAGEGLMAIMVPYWIGAWSDHLPLSIARRYGRRTFFLLIAAPIMAVAMALAPFVDGFWTIAALALVFFLALHSYLAPLWALMIDEVPPRRRGRVQGVRGALHSAGLAYGLVAAGLLYAIWEPLPFLTAAVLVLATTALTFVLAPQAAMPGYPPERAELFRVWRRLRGRPAMRWMLLANSLWSAGLDGIRPYIFLFATVVLGINVAQTSLLLMVIVGGLGLGALVVGRLGDRVGHARLLGAGALITGIAMNLGFFVREVPSAVALLLFSGLGAAALIALAYPLFASITGDRGIGQDTGLFIMMSGVGRIVSPVVIGAAIDVGRVAAPDVMGYPLMWPIAGTLTLLGVLALARAMTHVRRDRASQAAARRVSGTASGGA
jgi:MFS family permease